MYSIKPVSKSEKGGLSDPDIKRTKVCSRCGIEKSPSKFYKAKKNADGLRNACKICENVDNKGRYNLDGNNGWNQERKLANFIRMETGEGRKLTLFHSGVLDAIEASSEESPPMYKGLKVTPEMSKTAIEWLGKNGWGTPAARQPEPDVDDRTDMQLMTELEYLVGELGYKLVKI